MRSLDWRWAVSVETRTAGRLPWRLRFQLVAIVAAAMMRFPNTP